MAPKETYGATPANASATGAADATATLLDKPSGSADGSSRFWKDIGICVGSLALIVATFFCTIELMNYEYRRTTFEVYTGCMQPATTARLSISLVLLSRAARFAKLPGAAAGLDPARTSSVC